LALWQAHWVRERLAALGVAVEVVVIKTRGDAEIDRPLHQLEGKGFFTKEIEDALLDGRIDFAVHSLKDLPTRLPDGLALAAVPQRAEPVEALIVSNGGSTQSIAALPPHARLGTSSLRRVAQAKHLRSDLEIMPLRGNVPTRVNKVRGGDSGLDAALLAAAGLERLGLAGEIAARLDPLEIMPAPGQGALGLEIRADDRAARSTLNALADPATTRAVAAERALLAALGGGCQAPVAAFVARSDERAVLYGRVTATDGSVQLTASAPLAGDDPVAAGAEVARLLIGQGAEKFLAR
jgi:hydroxymethylbilane synthase